MQRVVAVKALADWKLEIVFADNTRGVVSVKDRLFGPMFEPLKDQEFFAKVSLDEFGVVCWPNGADLAPDAIYEKIKSHSQVA